MEAEFEKCGHLPGRNYPAAVRDPARLFKCHFVFINNMDMKSLAALESGKQFVVIGLKHI